MECVDQIGQLGFATPRRHRQRSDRHPITDPYARIPSEQQVRQRIDQEVLWSIERCDQTAAAGYLVISQPSHQDLG
jgi:hypothetical protein